MIYYMTLKDNNQLSKFNLHLVVYIMSYFLYNVFLVNNVSVYLLGLSSSIKFQQTAV